MNISAGVQNNFVVIQMVRPNSSVYDLLCVSEPSLGNWTQNRDSIVIPLKAGVQLIIREYFLTAGFRYGWYVHRIG